MRSKEKRERRIRKCRKLEKRRERRLIAEDDPTGIRPAKMASFPGVEVFLRFEHSLELEDLSASERCSHLLPPRLPVRARLEEIVLRWVIGK